MRQKTSASICRDRILTGAKNHIATDRVGDRVHRAGRFGRTRVGMNPHGAKVVPKPFFHECARVWIERLAAGADYVVYYCGNALLFVRQGVAVGAALEP